LWRDAARRKQTIHATADLLRFTRNLSLIEQAAGEVGLHRLNQPARRLRVQITLDRVGPGDHTELAGSSAVMFVKIKDGSKRRFALESRQLHSPVGLGEREGAIGCAKIESDCLPQDCFLPACGAVAPLQAIAPPTEICSLTLGKEFLKQRRKVGRGQFFDGCGGEGKIENRRRCKIGADAGGRGQRDDLGFALLVGGNAVA
jgi:hypothetical protein